MTVPSKKILYYNKIFKNMIGKATIFSPWPFVVKNLE